MKTTRASASPTFDHPSDIIFAAMSEVCYSRSILPCAAFEDVPIRVRSTAAGEGAPHVSHPTTIKLAARTDARDKKPSTDRTLDGETLGSWCDELKPWIDEGAVMRVSFGFANLSSLQSTGTILEEYVFDIRAGSPSKDDATTSNVLELLQSLRFLSQTFDEVDTTEPLVAFAKVYLEPDYAPKLQHANLFDDARERGVSYYDKAPFQLRVGRVHTASGRVVMMGVCSSLDSLNAADEGKKNRSRVPDNLPMCSSEEPGMGPGGRTPIKRPAVGPSEATPRGPPHSSRRRGRLAALHFNSASD